MSPDIMGRVLQLLDYQGEYSRNQHYQEFNGEEGKKVLRLYRIYNSLMKELREGIGRSEIKVSARSQASGLLLMLENSKLAYRRTCLVPLPLAAYFKRELKLLGLGWSPSAPSPDQAAVS